MTDEGSEVFERSLQLREAAGSEGVGDPSFNLDFNLSVSRGKTNPCSSVICDTGIQVVKYCRVPPCVGWRQMSEAF